jgi:beta-lactam-binding protein with PASTA domain
MGLSEQQVTVPSVIGLNLNDVRTLLIANSLTIGHVSYDEEFIDSKADKYIVYQQTPINGSFVQGGTAIDLKLSLDIEKTVTTDSSEEEEEFF